jgi:hypothetical protein
VKSNILKDEKILILNEYPIQIKYYDSEIIISDEYDNEIKISKKEPNSFILKLIGSYKTK